MMYPHLASSQKSISSLPEMFPIHLINTIVSSLLTPQSPILSWKHTVINCEKKNMDLFWGATTQTICSSRKLRYQAGNHFPRSPDTYIKRNTEFSQNSKSVMWWADILWVREILFMIQAYIEKHCLVGLLVGYLVRQDGGSDGMEAPEFRGVVNNVLAGGNGGGGGGWFNQLMWLYHWLGCVPWWRSEQNIDRRMHLQCSCNCM